MPNLSPETVRLFNQQIAREQSASLSYLSLSIWCDNAGFDGAAKFYHAAAAEEITHRDKFITFLVGLDALPLVPVVGPAPMLAPPSSLLDTVSAVIQLEAEVTKAIQALYQYVEETRECLATPLLLWALQEQVDSTATLLRIKRWFSVYGDDLAMIDSQIGGLA